MTTDKRKQVISRISDKEARDFFVAAQINEGLPFQVRAMREERGWSQADLGERTNKAQATISQLENPGYGSFTLSTLKRMASAFDVGLIVRFAPFSDLVNWSTNLSPRDLAVPSFDNDPGLSASPDTRDHLNGSNGNSPTDNGVTYSTSEPIAHKGMEQLSVCNVENVAVRINERDVRIEFGLKTGTAGDRLSGEMPVSVALSISQAKSLIECMSRSLSALEKQVGEIKTG